VLVSVYLIILMVGFGAGVCSFYHSDGMICCWCLFIISFKGYDLVLVSVYLIILMV
jgi:hypothetical protein